jgi:hypothetical protein
MSGFEQNSAENLSAAPVRLVQGAHDSVSFKDLFTAGRALEIHFSRRFALERNVRTCKARFMRHRNSHKPWLCLDEDSKWTTTNRKVEVQLELEVEVEVRFK